MLPIQALQRHEKAVHSMAVVHDTVFTGSEDQEIKVSVDLYDFCGGVFGSVVLFLLGNLSTNNPRSVSGNLVHTFM